MGDTFSFKEETLLSCFSDLEIIKELLNKIILLISAYDNKNTKLFQNSFSLPSISYKIFQNSYDKWGVTSLKNNVFMDNLIRNAYYGGRCEVFGNPNKGDKIHYFDYRGMYATCMKEEFPIEGALFQNKNLSIQNMGFHTIKYKCNSFLPFLPFRHKNLIFPNGELTGTFWYEEILNAVENNKCEILEHYNSLIYSKKFSIFKEFVEEFTKIRENGGLYNIIGKNIINNLYGSFALKKDEYLYLVCNNSLELDSCCELFDILS